MTSFFKRYLKRIAIPTTITAAVVAVPYLLFRTMFPYGPSHCCINVISLALEQYATTHDGHYPTGKESSEASLSLLHYQGDWALDANLLRGKTVPVEVVQGIFDKQGFLDPQTCGWHYVEGLTRNDDRRLAILWDKVGLGHAGERYLDGGREVLFVGGLKERIPHADWPKFLKEQELLLANRDESAVKGGPVLVGQIKLPSGELLDHFDGEYQFEETVSTTGGRSNGTRSGLKLRPSDLKWMGKDFQADEERTLVLVLPDVRLRSKPMTVKVEKKRLSLNTIIFEMEEAK